MRKVFNYFVFSILFILSAFTTGYSQESNGEGASYKGPGSLNVGLNINGGFGIHGDYEFNLAQDFTVGPSVDMAWWSNYSYNWAYYNFSARFRWYADRVIGFTDDKWDLYALGDAGFIIYSYPNDAYNDLYSWSPFNIQLGAGGKYHINDKIGIQATQSFFLINSWTSWNFQIGVVVQL